MEADTAIHTPGPDFGEFLSLDTVAKVINHEKILAEHNLSNMYIFESISSVTSPNCTCFGFKSAVCCRESRRKSDNFQTFDYIFLRYHTSTSQQKHIAQRGHQGGLPCCGTVEDPLLWLLWFAAA